MKLSRILCGLTLVLFIFGCSNGAKRAESNRIADFIENADEIHKTDSIKAVNYWTVNVHSSAAVVNHKDSVHKFIRTADLKFKVKSVITSTYDIESIIGRQGGFVTYTKLESTNEGNTSTAISADSSLETTFFRVSNTMTLRIPNLKLDTTLKEIARNIEFLDYRIIKADDVALQLFGNTLTQQRSFKNEARLVKAIDNHGKKLKETTVAEEIVVNKQEQADKARLDNMALREQINYSTINIVIYQRSSVKRELISNNNNIKGYEPGFGARLINSFQYGYAILTAIIEFMVKLWGLVVLAALVYIGRKVYLHKFNKHNETSKPE